MTTQQTDNPVPNGVVQDIGVGQNFATQRQIDPAKKAQLTASFQPNGYNPASQLNQFGSSEVYWFNCGIWGQAGYAIPNDGGKPVTGNDRLREIHQFLGAELFELMHRPDVKFSRPPNVTFLEGFAKAVTLGIKRLGDFAIKFTEPRPGDKKHNVNTPRSFVYYPVPLFGDRIRQPHAKRWCRWMLETLGEMMQHSDNDYEDDVTTLFVAPMQEQLRRILKDMASAFLGAPEEAVDAPGFVINDVAWASYDPTALFTDRELTDERHPEQWWPASRDLSTIKAMPVQTANVFAERWPDAANFYGDFGDIEGAFPGLAGDRVNVNTASAAFGSTTTTTAGTGQPVASGAAFGSGVFSS